MLQGLLQKFHTVLSLFLSPMQLPDKYGITALLAVVYEDPVDCVKVLDLSPLVYWTCVAI